MNDKEGIGMIYVGGGDYSFTIHSLKPDMVKPPSVVCGPPWCGHDSRDTHCSVNATGHNSSLVGSVGKKVS